MSRSLRVPNRGNSSLSSVARYWIRVRVDRGDYPLEPRLVRFLLNTTIAAQTVTLQNEILGSSEGSKSARREAAADILEPLISASATRLRRSLATPEDARRGACRVRRHTIVALA